MFSEGQSLYLQEVLGVTPGDLICVSSTVRVPVVVLTGAMAPEERELLERILGSVKLPTPKIIESVDPEQAAHAQNILLFAGGAPGRDGRLWQFPKLSDMVGGGTEVNAKKKLTWTLLQQLEKEL